MTKSEEVIFISKKLKLLSATELNEYIKEAPLKNKERKLILDIWHGYNLKELAERNDLSYSRVSQFKREIYKKLYEYDNRQIVIPQNQEKRININEIIDKKIDEAFSKKEEELKQKEELLNKYIEKETKKKIDRKLQQIKKTQNLNTRGTKRAVPEVILDKQIQDDIEEMSEIELKKKYIPMYARNEISTKELCNIFGHSINWACNIRKQYLQEGKNFSFEHKNKGHIPKHKTSDEIKSKIINLYSENYRQFAISDFTKILNEKYEIKISKETVSRVLKEKGIKSPISDKFLGQAKESLGNDFFSVMELFHSSVTKEDYSDIEEYGLIQICELSFLKAYAAINSISKKKLKLRFRTTYSLFEYFINNGYLNIKEAWSYWNNNHDKFSYIYNKPIRYKVILDIKRIYYPMFVYIEDYIKKMKEELDK